MALLLPLVFSYCVVNKIVTTPVSLTTVKSGYTEMENRKHTTPNCDPFKINRDIPSMHATECSDDARPRFDSVCYFLRIPEGTLIALKRIGTVTDTES